MLKFRICLAVRGVFVIALLTSPIARPSDLEEPHFLWDIENSLFQKFGYVLDIADVRSSPDGRGSKYRVVES